MALKTQISRFNEKPQKKIWGFFYLKSQKQKIGLSEQGKRDKIKGTNQRSDIYDTRRKRNPKTIKHNTKPKTID